MLYKEINWDMNNSSFSLTHPPYLDTTPDFAECNVHLLLQSYCRHRPQFGRKCLFGGKCKLIHLAPLFMRKAEQMAVLTLVSVWNYFWSMLVCHYSAYLQQSSFA